MSDDDAEVFNRYKNLMGFAASQKAVINVVDADELYAQAGLLLVEFLAEHKTLEPESFGKLFKSHLFNKLGNHVRYATRPVRNPRRHTPTIPEQPTEDNNPEAALAAAEERAIVQKLMEKVHAMLPKGSTLEAVFKLLQAEPTPDELASRKASSNYNEDTLSLTEMAGRLGLPKYTVQRAVKALRELTKEQACAFSCYD